MYLPRTLEQFVKTAEKQFPVLLVTGARQVGKTTFLQHVSKESRSYVTLDDPLVLSLAREDPALFMQRFPPPVLIDEIQYAPKLLPHIKMYVDKEGKPGRFWLTGSQQFQLMKGISESLAGRVGVVNLLGLSRREIIGQCHGSVPFLPVAKDIRSRISTGGKLTLKELYGLIWRGTFPAIALHKEMDRDLFYSSYVQTYLQRDIRDLSRVGNEMAFLRFLRASAARSGQMLNMADLARDADVAFNTQRDSQMHYLVQQWIADSLESKTVNLTPEELGKIWDTIERHIELEKKSVEAAEQSLASLKGKSMVIQTYLLNYLLEDERKHNNLLASLDSIKRKMYPYG